jgi:hypothetical protein
VRVALSGNVRSVSAPHLLVAQVAALHLLHLQVAAQYGNARSVSAHHPLAVLHADVTVTLALVPHLAVLVDANAIPALVPPLAAPNGSNARSHLPLVPHLPAHHVLQCMS